MRVLESKLIYINIYFCRHTKFFESEGFTFCGVSQKGFSENICLVYGTVRVWCLGERRVFLYTYIQHRPVKVIRVVSVNLIQFFQRATRIWILTRMGIYYKDVRPYIYITYR
jgi:hypothetical protein